MIESFGEMISFAEDAGILFFSRHPNGLLSLAGSTPGDIWYTGLDNDPWRWKDEAAEKGLLAYMKGINGRPALISKAALPYAIAHYGSVEELEERYSYGEVSSLEKHIFDFLDEDGKSTNELKREFARNKKGQADVEAALVRLQRTFDITSSGTRQKRAADGHLYGWPSMMYKKMRDWCPEAREASFDIPGSDARDYLRALFLRQNPALADNEIAALLKNYV